MSLHELAVPVFRHATFGEITAVDLFLAWQRSRPDFAAARASLSAQVRQTWGTTDQARAERLLFLADIAEAFFSAIGDEIKAKAAARIE